jgi:hypothetical protein
VVPVPQKDRSDWMAFVLILFVFAALCAALLTIGNFPVPYLSHH